MYVRLLYTQVSMLKLIWALCFRFLVYLSGVLGLELKPLVAVSMGSAEKHDFKKFSEPYRMSKADIEEINIEVPEELVKRAADHVGGDNNQYHNLLRVAGKYREANLNPVFLTDREQDIWRVTSREFMENPNIIN